MVGDAGIAAAPGARRTDRGNLRKLDFPDGLGAGRVCPGGPEMWSFAAVAWAAQVSPRGRTVGGTATPVLCRKAGCLWEADSVEAMRDLVDGALGPYSRNEYFAADEGAAVGLRAATAGAAAR